METSEIIKPTAYGYWKIHRERSSVLYFGNREATGTKRSVLPSCKSSLLFHDEPPSRGSRQNQITCVLTNGLSSMPIKMHGSADLRQDSIDNSGSLTSLAKQTQSRKHKVRARQRKRTCIGISNHLQTAGRACWSRKVFKIAMSNTWTRSPNVLTSGNRRQTAGVIDLPSPFRS